MLHARNITCKRYYMQKIIHAKGTTCEKYGMQKILHAKDITCKRYDKDTTCKRYYMGYDTNEIEYQWNKIPTGKISIK